MRGVLCCYLSYLREIGTLLSDYGSDLSEEQKKIFEVVLKGYVGCSSSVRAVECVFHRRCGYRKELSAPRVSRGAPRAGGEGQGVCDRFHRHRGLQYRRNYRPLLRRFGHCRDGPEPHAPQDPAERERRGSLENLQRFDHRRDLHAGWSSLRHTGVHGSCASLQRSAVRRHPSGSLRRFLPAPSGGIGAKRSDFLL